MKRTTKYMALGLAIGMCFGVSIGIAVFDNMALGISIGMCIGMAIGAAKDATINKQLEENGYTVKSVKESENCWIIVIADKNCNEREIEVSKEIMKAQSFQIGDTVYLDEEGNLEQAFDK